MKKKVYFNLKTSKISTKNAVANLHPLCSLKTISSEFMEMMEKEEEGWVKACHFGSLRELWCAGCVMELCLYCKPYCAWNIWHLLPEHGAGRDAAVPVSCVCSVASPQGLASEDVLDSGLHTGDFREFQWHGNRDRTVVCAVYSSNRTENCDALKFFCFFFLQEPPLTRMQWAPSMSRSKTLTQPTTPISSNKVTTTALFIKIFMKTFQISFLRDSKMR